GRAAGRWRHLPPHPGPGVVGSPRSVVARAARRRRAPPRRRPAVPEGRSAPLRAAVVGARADRDRRRRRRARRAAAEQQRPRQRCRAALSRSRRHRGRARDGARVRERQALEADRREDLAREAQDRAGPRERTRRVRPRSRRRRGTSMTTKRIPKMKTRVAHEADDDLGYLGCLEVDGSTVLACGGTHGHSTILRSTDGGKTFVRCEPPLTSGLRWIGAVAGALYV